jgi:hypothetical protein
MLVYNAAADAAVSYENIHTSSCQIYIASKKQEIKTVTKKQNKN